MTFLLFLEQCLILTGSCRNAVQKTALEHVSADRAPVSPNTSGYCQARQRLPVSYLKERFQHTITAAAKMTTALNCWYGHTVMVVDATSLHMPDTLENQRVFPQNRHQKPGCGFPLAQLCGVFDLASGTMVHYDITHSEEHEVMQMRRMHKIFAPDTVILADRGFSGFTDVALLQQREVHCVVRKHQRLSKSLQSIKRLGRNDYLCRWHKANYRPARTDPDIWRSLPDSLLVRRIRVSINDPGKRTQTIEIITTLIDHKIYPADAFAELYLRRWRVELFFDDIKTAMGMDMLRCKSPDMVIKEILVHMIAYNLVRLLMCAASLRHGIPVEHLSFTGTRDIIELWQPSFATSSPSIMCRFLDAMLQYVAYDKLPHRPGRREPRALKRRPKPYQLLTDHRHVFLEIQHRNVYRKPLS